MGTDLVELETKLWEAADELRANSKLKPAEFAVPVLGLVFLRYADARFMDAREDIEGSGSGRYTVTPDSYKAKGITYVPESARWERIKALTEKDNLGQELDAAMAAIEADNADLHGVLPRTYTKVSNETLIGLIRLLNGLSDIEGDAFGLIYEYFLGNFAMAEGSKGGEFFTPTSIVKLMVEILEPTKGKMLDPACGSGGMFVQSARFVERHHKGNPGDQISLYGQDRVEETVRLANMNLAIHGLEGNIREGNTYYDDLHNSVGAFDYVLANPPFNVTLPRQRGRSGPRRARRTASSSCGSTTPRVRSTRPRRRSTSGSGGLRSAVVEDQLVHDEEGSA